MASETIGASIRRREAVKTSGLIVRRDSVLCTRCFTSEPIHPGDGTPLPTFVVALELAAKRHAECAPRRRP